ncbi:hypothetical protein RYZ26_05985 [Terasakiella sp. A23]|uniref:hypothetical protein n=1 Tax=Terasakiella sp. FCG-A23 TaxID=3080561 RepID=UPI0029549A64|nr:hypothetical protein [Terasakiella sp. A23]MDV7339132.1 hypothetical protein [Terasakiella sp. A23]
MKTPFLSFVFAFSLITQAAALDGLVETNDFGTTDWAEGYIEATGQGTARYLGNRIQEELMAKQAARTTAQAHLLEIMKGIRVTGLTTLNEKAQSDARAATRIKGTIKGARVLSEKATWHKDKESRRGEVVLAEVTLRVCVSPVCSDTEKDVTTATLNLDTADQKPIKAAAKVGPTAVIIDLEKALYLPALAPEVINEDGKIVYSQETVHPDAARMKGLIHYTKSVDAAQAMTLSGDAPLIIKAKQITKDNRIVLANKDATRLKDLNVLQQGKLIVALD